MLPAALTVNDEYRQRFNREADIAATLWHPHIVEVHDRGELEGRLWISMDYIDGTDAGSPAAGALPQRHATGRGRRVEDDRRDASQRGQGERAGEVKRTKTGLDLTTKTTNDAKITKTICCLSCRSRLWPFVVAYLETSEGPGANLPLDPVRPVQHDDDGRSRFREG